MTSQPSEYVTLVSSDGFEFVVRRSAACVAGAIRRMLDPTSNFAEAISGRCVFENINGIVLEKVCEYFYYNEKFKNAKDVPDMDIPPELCLELLMAADYLNSFQNSGRCGVLPMDEMQEQAGYDHLKAAVRSLSIDNPAAK